MANGNGNDNGHNGNINQSIVLQIVNAPGGGDHDSKITESPTTLQTDQIDTSYTNAQETWAPGTWAPPTWPTINPV